MERHEHLVVGWIRSNQFIIGTTMDESKWTDQGKVTSGTLSPGSSHVRPLSPPIECPFALISVRFAPFRIGAYSFSPLSLSSYLPNA
jgi:hypothetical protein